VNQEELLLQLLGTDENIDEYWQKVKTNLQAGKIRMVFVADEIPSELRRVIEFMEEQMDPAQVLAIEVKQYAGEGLMTLVPRVLGKIKESKVGPEKRQWDEPTFIASMKSQRGDDEAYVFQRILDWTKIKEIHYWWGRGRKDGSFFPIMEYKGTRYWLFSIWTYGVVSLQFGMMQTRPVFDEVANRQELINRLNIIPGISIPEDGINRYPSIDLSLLQNEESLKQFLSIFDWVIEKIRNASA